MAVPAPQAPRARGIRTLLVLLVLSVYLPALLAAAALVVIEARDTWRRAEEDLLARTVLLSRALRLRIEGIQSHLDRLAADAPAEGEDLRALDQLAHLTADAAGIDGVIVTRPTGEQLVNTRRPGGEPLAQTSPDIVLEVARTGRTTLVNLTRTRYTRQLVVGVAVPVIRGGNVRYVAVGVLEARRLQDLVANMPQGWVAAIVDANRVVVARNRAPETFVGQHMTGDLLERVVQEEQGLHLSVTLDGVPVLTAFRTPPSLGWTVVMAVPRATLYMPVWRNAAWLACGATALLVFALWVATRLRRRIVDSVRVLVSEALEPPAQPPRGTLAFAEANDLRVRLHANARQLQIAQRTVERMHSEFQRALVQQMDRRQAELAAELHDNVGSALAGISLLLAQLRPAVLPVSLPLLEAVQRQVEKAAASVRQLSRGMMPAGEQQGGLPAALEQLALDFGSLDRRCAFLTRGDFGQLPTDTASQLFRIAQEAVSNAARHGNVSRIRIQLARDGDTGRLTVDDDGLGYDPGESERRAGGMGLRSMRTRAQAVDADIEFTRSPLGGARVRVAFPLDGRDGSDGGGA